MNNTDTNRIPARELKDELARLCLPSANLDPNRKFAWMNSICILFLLIGIFGSAPATVSVKPVPPVEEIAPVMLETAPPQTVVPNENQNQNEQRPEAPNVVVVVPNAPNISFSVPTIGNLVAPSAMAQAPPLVPMQPVAPVSMNQLSRISNTGASGSRPQPPYPRIASDAGEQGTVTLQMTADAEGRVASVQIVHSSGYPVLDRATEDFIRRHWTLPVGSTGQLFETSVIYQLQGG